MSCAVAIFAHNEARRIAACMASLPAPIAGTRFHVLVNGSTDGTAALARQASEGRNDVVVHKLAEGGKLRTWNRFVHDLLGAVPDVVVFMDGDAELAPGSIAALAADLSAHAGANAAAGLPLNGRRHRAYQAQLRAEGGLFGDLYALRGDFVTRILEQAIYLPDDLIGDDGLVAAMAMTDLGPDANWDRGRIVVSDRAGFYCEPTRLLSPATWRVQYRRMINYAERHFQNRIVSDIMGRIGPAGLPRRLAPLYEDWLPRFAPRKGLAYQWLDRRALDRVARKAGVRR